MKKILYFVVLLVLPLSLFSQLVENTPPFFSFFKDTPHYEIKPDGFGSFGFNNPLSNFNPSYLERSETFLFSVAGNANLHSSSYVKQSNSKHFDYFNEVVNIIPDFTIDLQMDEQTVPNNNLAKMQYRISYYTDLNIKNISNFKVGSSSLDYTHMIMYKTNSVLQLSVMKRMSDFISLSGSLITNQFEYSVKLPGYAKQAIESKLFDQVQFQSSFNLHTALTSVYFVVKSQASAVKLSPGRLTVFEEFMSGEGWNNGLLSYPGIFAFGINQKLSEQLSFSLESVNHFLLSDKKVKIKQTNYSRKEKFRHDEINHEVVAGMFVQASPIINFGCSFSYYLNYNYWGDHVDLIHKGLKYEIQNPLSANFSISSQLGNFDIGLNYQYSYARTKYIGDNTFGFEDETHQIHQLKFSLNYGML